MSGEKTSENVTAASVGSDSLLAALVRAQDEYIELLSAELSDVMPLAHIHHWRSKRVEAGASARRKIAELRSAANTEMTDANRTEKNQ